MDRAHRRRRDRPAFPRVLMYGCATAVLAGACPTQTPPPAPPLVSRPKVKVHKEANRMVRLLELESRRGDAVAGLLRLGSVAVPDLARGLSHPDIDTVRTIAHILRRLGTDANAAAPQLTSMATEKDVSRASVAKWALARIGDPGRIFVADYTDKAILEFDESGKMVHKIKVGSVWNAERLVNGNYLVCLIGDEKQIREVDREGKVVRKYDGIMLPTDAERLPDGNTLITDTGNSRVFELSPEGKKVWQYKSNSPYDADRLPNGNTLISDFSTNKVLEVDSRGKTVWEYRDAKGILSAERLRGGHTLMALYTARRVVEVDVKGKTVWWVDTPFNPDCALRLPNGNTLVGGQGQLREYDSKGKVVGTFKISRAASVDRY